MSDLVVIAFPSEAKAEEARKVGAVALLTKGALHEELKEAILAAAPQQELAPS